MSDGLAADICGRRILTGGGARLQCRAFGYSRPYHVCTCSHGHEGVCRCHCGQTWTVTDTGRLEVP